MCVFSPSGFAAYLLSLGRDGIRSTLTRGAIRSPAIFEHDLAKAVDRVSPDIGICTGFNWAWSGRRRCLCFTSRWSGRSTISGSSPARSTT